MYIFCIDFNSQYIPTTVVLKSKLHKEKHVEKKGHVLHAVKKNHRHIVRAKASLTQPKKGIHI